MLAMAVAIMAACKSANGGRYPVIAISLRWLSDWTFGAAMISPRGPVSTRCGREGDEDLGALAHVAHDADVAAMQVHQALHDGQAEACPVHGALGGERAAREGLEHRLDFMGRNAGAIVLDRQDHAA